MWNDLSVELFATTMGRIYCIYHTQCVYMYLANAKLHHKGRAELFRQVFKSNVVLYHAIRQTKFIHYRRQREF